MMFVISIFSVTAVRTRSMDQFYYLQQNQIGSSKESMSADGQGKTPDSRTSRFTRFGFGSQLLQKTVGLVLRPRPGRQVLSHTNTFHEIFVFSLSILLPITLLSAN